MKNKIFTILLLLSVGVNLLAQSSLPYVEMYNSFFNGEYIVCAKYFDKYSQQLINSSKLSSEDVTFYILGVISKQGLNPSSVSGELLDKISEQAYYEMEETARYFDNSRNKKPWILKNYILWSFGFRFIALINSKHINHISIKFQQYFMQNIDVLNPSINEEAIALANIFGAEAYLYVMADKSYLATGQVCDDLMNLYLTNNDTDVRRQIVGQLESMYFCFELDKLNETEELEKLSSYCITLNFMKLQLLQCRRVSDDMIANLKWKKVQLQLNHNECAVIIYKKNILFLQVYGVIAFSKTDESPHDLKIYITGKQSEMSTIRNALKNKYPSCDAFYVLPAENLECIDIAEDDSKFHVMYSFANLYLNTKKSYNNKSLAFFGAYDYGKGGPLENLSLNDYNYFRNNWSSKLIINSGNYYSRSEFEYPMSTIDIIHISTHGVELPVNGATMMKYGFGKYGLALQYYNADNRKNRLTGYDINKFDYRTIGLVVLFACNSAYYNHLEVNQITNTLTKSFYVAGAHNVIGFITKVEDVIANDLTILFYEKIKNGSMSYHDAFYQAKKEINKKYNINLSVVLWE